MNYLHEESNEVIHRNLRIGIGTTGICEALDKVDQWSDSAYRELRAFDAEWSAELGVNASIKLTTNKPSGTLSLLAGVTPGVHPAFAPFYIRRVRMSSDDTLIQYCKNRGYAVEFARNFDGSIDYNTSIVSFPCKSSDNAILAKDMTAIDQLELVKKMQTLWSDSAVSVTVYYHLEELPLIKEWLAENFETSVKSVSFLLHSNHGFEQAPYQEIDEQSYQTMLAHISLDGVADNGSGSLDLEECQGGSCPVK